MGTSNKNPKLLITGHTGFKAGWLALYCISHGMEVYGYSNQREQLSSYHYVNDLFAGEYWGDVSDLPKLREVFAKIQPTHVIHMAAEAIVRRSLTDPLTTCHTNIMGSLNVLQCCFEQNIDSALMVTSDKVYLNKEWEYAYRETDELGGKDPYSFSKAAADIALRGFINFKQALGANPRVGIARAGNVIGGGDFNQDRIIPDCAKAWKSKKAVELRNPNSTRPWQHVLDVVAAYYEILVSLEREDIDIAGEAFNVSTGIKPRTVLEVVTELAGHIGTEESIFVPNHLNDVEATNLSISSEKLSFVVGFSNRINHQHAIALTAQWYEQWMNGANKLALRNVMLSQLETVSKY